jgi:HNH endonuclease
LLDFARAPLIFEKELSPDGKNMKSNTHQDKKLLLATAQAVAVELAQHCDGTTIRIHPNIKVARADSNGWKVTLGNLGKSQPQLQIWLDHLAVHKDRKFWFGFRSEEKTKIDRMASRVARRLIPHHTITDKDIKRRDGYYYLKKPLNREGFNKPTLENYWGKYLYYGIFDWTVRSGGNSVNPYLCARAAAFFESVARAQPKAKPENVDREVYPQFENRKLVVSHLQRERSRLLATECKIRDQYQCQVCNTRFEHLYGGIGKTCVEAHHITPLSELKGRVKTRLEDMVTVCANCHRMLHRMADKRGDVEKLRAIVHKRKGKCK